MFRSVRPYLEEAGLDDPVVCYQGAVVADPRTRRVPAPRADPARARRSRRSTPSSTPASTSTATSTTALRRRGDAGGARRTPTSRASRSTRSAPLHEWLHDDPTKLVAVGDPDALDALEDVLKPRFAGRLFVSKSLPHFLEFAHPDVSKGSGLQFVADRLGFTPQRDRRVRRRRERPRAARLGRLRRRRRERARGHPRARRSRRAGRRARRRRAPARRLPRLPLVIDLRAARQRSGRVPRRARAQGRRRGVRRAARRRPRGARGAAARRGAAREAEARRASRRRSSSQELEQVKAELQQLEEQLAAAEARRKELLARVPNPPAEDTPDGFTDEDAVEVRRVGEPPAFDFPAKDHLDLAQALGWIDMERAAKVSGSRFAYRVGDLALLELSLYRYALDRLVQKGFTRRAAAGARARGGDVRHRLPADRRGEHLQGRARRALPHRHGGGRARGDAHGRDPRGRHAAAALRRLLDELPPRGGRRRQGHARHVPRAPVRQGRDVRLHDAGRRARRARAAARDRGGADRRPRHPVPRRQRRGRRPRRVRGEEVRHRRLVPRPGALPRADVDVEHDRLPGAPARHPHAARRQARARRDAERHRGHRAHGDRAAWRTSRTRRGAVAVPEALWEYGAPRRLGSRERV